jgi:hypothetical protein
MRRRWALSSIRVLYISQVRVDDDDDDIDDDVYLE